MLKYLYFFILFPFITKAQYKTTSYFDKRGMLTYVESSFYYRENIDTSSYYRSFYTNTKTKYFEGKILNAKDTVDINNIYSGVCCWYYPNGKLKIKSEYNQEGVLHGITEKYSDDGNLFKRINYVNGKIVFKKYSEFDKSGNRHEVFEEDFVNNDLNWELASNEKMSSKIKIGGLYITNMSKYDYAIFSKEKIDSVNYEIITSVNSNYLTDECKTGIIFGFKDWKNYNYYYVSKFRFHIGFVENGIVQKKVENYFSDNLNGSAVNELLIKGVNDSIYFFINNVLQSYCGYDNRVKSEKIGFYINNGTALFEDLIIKEHSKNSINLNNSSFTDLFEFNGHKIPVKQIYSGIVIGKNGYIASSLKNIPQINEIVVELLIKDTVKQYQADIFIQDNFTILKLRDTTVKLPEVCYNSYSYNQLVDNKFVVYSFERNFSNNSYYLNKIEGNAKYIGSHKHNAISSVSNNHYCIGAPVFDLKGGMLGVISNVENDNIIKTIGVRNIIYPLKFLPKTNELKSKENFLLEHYEKTISQNIVIIKVF